MRKKFVLFVLVPILALGVITYLFLDRWVEFGLEAAGEASVGARVEIDQLRLTISPLGAEFRRLQVANKRDPWKNVFETGTVKFAVDFGQLLRGKYIVETMEVNNLVIGTKRSTDGSLPRKPEPPKPKVEEPAAAPLTEQAQTVLVTEAKKTPMFDMDKLKKEFKIDSLLNVQNLRSLQHYDSLKQQVQQASEQWKTSLTDLEESKQRLADVEATVKSINVNELKTIEAVTSAITRANTSYKTVNDLNETFKGRRASLTEEINQLSTSVKSSDDIFKQDYQGLLALARLPDVDMQGLTEVLLGKDFFQQAQKYLYWVDFARTTVPQYIPKAARVESPPRFEGQTIQFPEERSYPKFWIKKILISGGEDKAQRPDYFYAKGQVGNIASNQKQTGLPLTIALLGERADRSSFSFDATFDRRPEVPVDNYKVRAAGVPIGQFTVGRSDFLPSRITEAIGTYEIDAEVPGNRIEASTTATFSNVTVVFDQNPRNDVERIVRDVLAGVKKFQVKLRMWNADGPFSVAFSTDLDGQISARTKQVIGAEIARIQNEIRSKLNQRVAAKRQEYENIFNEKKEEVMERLRGYESLVKDKLALVEGKKKELEEEKKKQEEALKKKGVDVLKGILKKR